MKNEILKVDFYKAELGCLDFKIKAGKQGFENSFSEAFDPLLDFKHWLEAISIGVAQCSFNFDTESEDINFNFERITWEQEVFTIGRTYAPKTPHLLKAEIGRHQLVNAFYCGLLKFEKSDSYEPVEWEGKTIKKCIEEKTGFTDNDLIEHLLNLKQKEFFEMLLEADSTYEILLLDEKDENKVFEQIIAHYVDKQQTALGKPYESPIINAFNQWTREEREKFVQYILKENVHWGFEGMKLLDFRSSIIENYLDFKTF